LHQNKKTVKLVDNYGRNNPPSYLLQRNYDAYPIFKIIRAINDSWAAEDRGTNPFKLKDTEKGVSLRIQLGSQKPLSVEFTHEEISALYELLNFYAKEFDYHLIYSEENTIEKQGDLEVDYSRVNITDSIWPELEDDKFFTESFIGAPGHKDIETVKFNYSLTKD
jgi:hypothetical protein